MKHEIFINDNEESISVNIFLEKWIRSIAVAEAAKIGNVWVICRVFVRPQHRGQGFGSIALKALINKAKKTKGPLYVTPGGYNYDPKLQISFYKKHGFKKQRPNCQYGSYKLSIR